MGNLFSRCQSQYDMNCNTSKDVNPKDVNPILVNKIFNKWHSCSTPSRSKTIMMNETLIKHFINYTTKLSLINEEYKELDCIIDSLKDITLDDTNLYFIIDNLAN